MVGRKPLLPNTIHIQTTQTHKPSLSLWFFLTGSLSLSLFLCMFPSLCPDFLSLLNTHTISLSLFLSRAFSLLLYNRIFSIQTVYLFLVWNRNYFVALRLSLFFLFLALFLYLLLYFSLSMSRFSLYRTLSRFLSFSLK